MRLGMMRADKADEESEPDTPDSYSKLIKMVNVRKSPWHGRHLASKTTMAADNADEDSEREKSGYGSGDSAFETSMAADENSELDTSATKQPHFPIQKESKKQGFKIQIPVSIQGRSMRGNSKHLDISEQSGQLSTL